MLNQYKEIVDYIIEWELGKSLSEMENLKELIQILKKQLLCYCHI